MGRLRPKSIMKFLLHRHKNKKGLSLDNSPGYDTSRQGYFEPPSADDRKFLHHASDEAVAAWKSIHSPAARASCPPPTARSAYIVAHLSRPILDRILFFVCPHTQDESYETCEQSAIDEATCALCDTRDLAHCANVSKRWRASAIKVLYHSIRLDPVHYCDREIYLSERRRMRSKFDRNGIPEDATAMRLALLARTLRDDPTRIGSLVRFLKLPYMLRESNQADLARTLAVLPGVRYVDLPEGLFSDEQAFATLKLEVQVRCPDLRKMTYVGGAERSFALLAQGNTWRNLEVLELKKMNIDPLVLRQVLGMLGNLRALNITDTRSFTDDVFTHSDVLPPFPPLEEFVLTGTPDVTSAGLVAYLDDSVAQRTLKVLALNNTGVQPITLRELLRKAPALRTLAISMQVATQLSVADTSQPMGSLSLQVLHYEISSAPSAGSFNTAAAGHYAYLADCILGGCFPSLRAVYVRDPTFFEQLLGLAPPPFGHRASASLGSLGRGNQLGVPGGHANPHTPNNNNNNKKSALSRTLEVFSKDEDGMDRSLVKVQPHPSSTRHIHSRSYSSSRSPALSPGSPANGFDSLLAVPGRSQRPVSSYGLGADVTGLGWQSGGTRHSIMVGNGAGGFLAVPGSDYPCGRRGSSASATEEWPRPKSSSGEKANMNLWR